MCFVIIYRVTQRSFGIRSKVNDWNQSKFLNLSKLEYATQIWNQKLIFSTISLAQYLPKRTQPHYLGWTWSQYPEIPDLHIKSEGVCKPLAQLNPNKAQGPNNIPARFLMDYHYNIVKPLPLAFKASIQQCMIPDDWRQAHAIPKF